ncbi:MAG: 50S ribosomal protein L10 [Chloroflexi bacterium]|nr:50S ribosomal protein L10 [Chloroflexota bacterium]
MPLTRDEKGKILDELNEKLGRAEAVLISDYRGLRVKDIQNVRGQLRKSDANLIVVKNTLLRLALEKNGLPTPEKLLSGPTAAAICFSDIAGPAKILNDFARDTKILTIKGAIIGHSVVEAAGFDAVVNMPTRAEIFSKVLRAFNAPSTNVVGTVAGGIRQILNVLQARVDQLKEQENAA